MLPIVCALCGKKQKIQLFYPATFSPSRIGKDIYSARRMPDRIHYRIVRCKRCGLIFSSPIFPPEKIANWYRQSSCTYSSQVPYLVTTYLKLYEDAKHLLPPDPRVLEIGCGNGYFLSALRDNGIWDVWGVEPGKDMVAKAPLSLRDRIVVDVFKKHQFPDNTFDLVCCFHTLDHVVAPLDLAKLSFSLLKRGGVMIVVTHDTEGLSVKLFGERSPIFDIEHIFLFNKKTISELFKRATFAIVNVKNLVNTYPLSYWIRMSGLGLNISWLPIDPLVSLAGGNLVLVAQKP